MPIGFYVKMVHGQVSIESGAPDSRVGVKFESHLNAVYPKIYSMLFFEY
jgi:hypothetical protein